MTPRGLSISPTSSGNIAQRCEIHIRTSALSLAQAAEISSRPVFFSMGDSCPMPCLIQAIWHCQRATGSISSGTASTPQHAKYYFNCWTCSNITWKHLILPRNKQIHSKKKSGQQGRTRALPVSRNVERSLQSCCCLIKSTGCCWVSRCSGTHQCTQKLRHVQDCCLPAAEKTAHLVSGHTARCPALPPGTQAGSHFWWSRKIINNIKDFSVPVYIWN